MWGCNGEISRRRFALHTRGHAAELTTHCRYLLSPSHAKLVNSLSIRMETHGLRRKRFHSYPVHRKDPLKTAWPS